MDILYIVMLALIGAGVSGSLYLLITGKKKAFKLFISLFAGVISAMSLLFFKKKKEFINDANIEINVSTKNDENRDEIADEITDRIEKNKELIDEIKKILAHGDTL